MASEWSRTDKSRKSSQQLSVSCCKDGKFLTSILKNKVEQNVCVFWKRPSKDLEATRVCLKSIDVDQVISSASIKCLEQINRMIDRYGKENFLILNFSRKLETAVVRDILRGGIVINEEEYQFIGCSSGGLKSRTCYMFRGSLQKVHDIWAECGNFSSIRSRYKRLKRIGLLFSSAVRTEIVMSLDSVKEMPDIELGDYNFTDGCGAISKDLANQIAEQCKIEGKPSVFQIRYQGCKGVVAVDNTLSGKKLVMRPSMKKFNPGTKPFNELWLCDYSRPYSFGHLNRQYITLLSSLGVSNEALLSIQHEYFELLQNVIHNVGAALQLLLLDNQPELATHCTEDCFLVKYRPQLTKLKSKALSKLDKLRLPVVKSRNVFGVCDTTGKLKYGQCYFRFTDHGQSKALCGKIVVAKNPCYMLGDVRVLTAVDIPGLDHLVDCIVFPTQGDRPHPSEIAGSDLDGDQYFISWDKRLIVPHVHKPYDYPSIDATETNTDITQEVLIDFFASQKNNMGKIDSYYKYWANKKGAGCEECQILGQLFSRSVDATKTGDVVSIPPNLVPPLDSEMKDKTCTLPPTKPHVWEEMERRAREKKEELSHAVIATVGNTGVDVLTDDFLWSLIEHRLPSMTEFQLLQLIFRWCRSQYHSEDECHKNFLQFAQHLHFGELTLEEQITAVNIGVPLKTVSNALNQSTLPKALLEKFSLDDPHRNWRFYFRASSADFKWKNLLKGIQTHPESLLVINLSDEVTFVIHFLSSVNLGETDFSTGTVVTYFSSGHFGLNLQTALGSDYKMTLDEDKLQIYQGQKQATFIWLSRERELKHPKKAQQVDTLFDRISVDLTRFKKDVLRSSSHPKVNKESFLSIEMFVKTENSQQAYLDYVEADLQSDFSITEQAVSADIEDLPNELAESEDSLFMECPIPGSEEAALVLIADCAKSGNINFSKALEVVNFKDNPELCRKLFHQFSTLICTIQEKFCHSSLSDKVEDCLCSILISINQFKTSPILVLHLLTASAQLKLYNVMDAIIDVVLSTTEATQISEYFDVISKWQFWYFLPSNIASKLSHTLYGLYSSLVALSTLPQEERPVLSQLMQLANDTETNEPFLNQHQARTYSLHFASLIHKHLLCEMYSLQNQQETHDSDTATSLVKMQCYNYKHPHTDTSTASDVVEETTEQVKIGFKRSDGRIFSKNFTTGSYVAISLMIKKHSTGEVRTQCIAIGCIVKVSRAPADVVVEVNEPVPLCLKKCVQHGLGHWKLALVGNITLFKRSLKSLRSLTEDSTTSTLLSLLVQTHKCVHPYLGTESIPIHLKSVCDSKELLTYDLCLNPNQQKATIAAVSRRLTLIHGPPGTGKTHVACEIVLQQLKQNDNYPILVVAETNLAVDNLCEKLLSRDVRVVRIGKLEQISPSLRDKSLEGQLEKKRIHEGKDKTRSQYPSKSLVRPIIKAAQVVAATCTSAGDPSLKGMKFPFVIVDEATQVAEPTLLIPLMFGCQQLTLIGDPEQLAPSITGSQVSDFNIDDLSVTLFHRLHKFLPLSSVFLNEQHRMHPDLVVFPSNNFYGGKLLTAKSRIEKPSIFQEIDSAIILSKKAPCVFINIEQPDKRVGTSFYNETEAKTVTNVIKRLVSCKISTQQMAVLTPYTGQVRCIQEQCQREKISHVKIHTIDSFQGRESDVIIFSSVRCNSAHELGFMNDRFRMNVLLTRAKHCLIGIGSKNTLLNGSQLWKKWLATSTVKVINEEELNEPKKAKQSTTQAVNRQLGDSKEFKKVDGASEYRQRDELGQRGHISSQRARGRGSYHQSRRGHYGRHNSYSRQDTDHHHQGGFQEPHRRDLHRGGSRGRPRGGYKAPGGQSSKQ